MCKKYLHNTNSKIMGKFEDWLYKKTQFSLQPSFVRWGVVPFILSVGLFLLALSSSIYSFYLSIVVGNMTIAGLSTTAVGNITFGLAIILLIVGIIVAMFAICLCLYLFGKQNTLDPIVGIDTSLKSIAKDVSKISKRLGVDEDEQVDTK